MGTARQANRATARRVCAGAARRWCASDERGMGGSRSLAILASGHAAVNSRCRSAPPAGYALCPPRLAQWAYSPDVSVLMFLLKHVRLLACRERRSYRARRLTAFRLAGGLGAACVVRAIPAGAQARHAIAPRF